MTKVVSKSMQKRLAIMKRPICDTCGRPESDDIHWIEGARGSTWHPFKKQKEHK